MLKCKINREFNIYDAEQLFDKNINFKISLGGGVHFSNALIYNRDSINFKDYNDEEYRSTLLSYSLFCIRRKERI